jgi:hypothetical protein
MERRTRDSRRDQGWAQGGRPWLVTAGLLLLLAIVAVPTYGYYRAYAEPANQWAGRVDGGVVVTVGEVAERIQTLALLNETSGGSASAGGNPFEILRSMVEDELVRDIVTELGVPASEANTDTALRERFLPAGSTARVASEEQLEREFQEAYSHFLTRGRLSDKEYRELIRIQIFRELLKMEIANRVPRVAEQVEVAWIVLPGDFGEEESVIDLLRQGEPFESVARVLNTERYFADTSQPGYVGWVPKGAFPDLDPYLFEASPEAGSLIGPISSRDGTYIIAFINGPSIGDIQNEKMISQMRDEGFERWLEEEWRERKVEIQFTSDDYRWVLDQVEDNLPASF